MQPAGRGAWRVKTQSMVGVALGEGWELRVKPKMDVPRLLFLLGYARDPHGWRDQITGFDVQDELIPAIANGFSWHLTWALDRGPLRGYVRREERLHNIRGRVLFATHLARSGSFPLPIDVAYDDFTEDIIENRMLLTASSLVLRLPALPAEARRRLLRARSVFESVAPLSQWRGVRAPAITRINARYAPALRLSELILAASAHGSDTGKALSTTFAFDMNVVFEDFLTTAFREAMGPYGGEVRDQVKDHSLDVGDVLKLKPDLSWWKSGRCQAVLDAKYKEVREGQMKHPDAYQMVSYCLAYGLPRGYLVYARDSGKEPTTHTIRNSGIEVVVESIDVSLEPAALLASVKRLAERIAAHAQSTARSAA
jgi:5-methylcytosine-specific restriction enzyme subunit McrC